MTALTIIVAILDVLVCIVLLGLIAVQEGGSKGLGSLAGNFETFLDKTKGGTFEEKLQRFTSIAAISFAVLSVILYLLTGRVA